MKASPTVGILSKTCVDNVCPGLNAKVFAYLEEIVQKIITNIVENMNYIAQVSGSTTVTKKHFNALMKITSMASYNVASGAGAKSSSSSPSIKYGGTVLPYEYFNGPASDANYQSSMSGDNTSCSMDSPLSFARMGIPSTFPSAIIQEGGGNKCSMLNGSAAKHFMIAVGEKYSKPLTFGAGTSQIVVTCVNKYLHDILDECALLEKVTITDLKKVMKNNNFAFLVSKK